MAAADNRSERALAEAPVYTYEQSVIIEAGPEALYDLVSDITRIGEWSPVCRRCWWDEASEAGQVGETRPTLRRAESCVGRSRLG